MAELDCRVVAMFALALTLLFLGGVIFIRHHHHHNPGAVHHTSEALVVERDWPLCDCNDDMDSVSDELPATSTNQLSEACLQCICEAGTECKPSKCAGDEMCGLFRISQPYWVDAGSPTVDSAAALDSGDDLKKGYLLCVNNPFCAARTVNGYIGKYVRDCDGNGVIDCYDYAAIHIQGPSGCKREEMPPWAFNRLDRCLVQFTVM